jgi:hypothetical protein
MKQANHEVRPRGSDDGRTYGILATSFLREKQFALATYESGGLTVGERSALSLVAGRDLVVGIPRYDTHPEYYSVDRFSDVWTDIIGALAGAGTVGAVVDVDIRQYGNGLEVPLSDLVHVTDTLAPETQATLTTRELVDERLLLIAPSDGRALDNYEEYQALRGTGLVK